MISGDKQKTSQQVAELIASYVRWRSGGLGQITEALEQQLLVELLGPIAGQTLLDVGCGDGVARTSVSSGHPLFSRTIRVNSASADNWK
jgi:hypothetical protein